MNLSQKQIEQRGTGSTGSVLFIPVEYSPCGERCTVGSHPSRHDIDRQLIAGTPFRTIAAAFGLSLGTIHRHKEKHLKQALADAMRSQQNEREEHGSELFNRVQRLVGECEGILETAKSEKDLKAATSAIGAATRLLELVGRLTGELATPNAGGIHLNLTSTRVTINTSPGSDQELAELIAEATDGFNPVVIERFKALAEGERYESASGWNGNGPNNHLLNQ